MQSDCDQSELRSHAIIVFRFSVTELSRTAQRVGQYTKLNMPVLTGYAINEFQECGMTGQWQHCRLQSANFAVSQRNVTVNIDSTGCNKRSSAPVCEM
jgi:hypothetical protein